MAGQHREDDDVAYFAAKLGLTYRLAMSGVAAQTSDDDGALPPGRYLIHLGNLTNGARVWVQMGVFAKGGTITPVIGPPSFPMSTTRIQAIEVNVRKGANDRVAAILESTSQNPSGELFITNISWRA